MGPRPLGQTRVLRPGDFLFTEGQPLRMVYVIAEGSLRAAVRDPRDMTPTPIAEETFGTGSVFGWNYMLWQDGDPPSLAPFSTFVSENTLRCIVECYTREEFLEHLRDRPDRVFAYVAEAPRVLSKLMDPTRIAGVLSTAGEASIPPPRPSQPGGTISILQKSVRKLQSELQLFVHLISDGVLPLLKPHRSEYPGIASAISTLQKLIGEKDDPGSYRHVSGVRPAARREDSDGVSDGDRETPLEIPKTADRRG